MSVHPVFDFQARDPSECPFVIGYWNQIGSLGVRGDPEVVIADDLAGLFQRGADFTIATSSIFGTGRIGSSFDGSSD